MKISKIIFGDIAFRMLKNVEINISERITVIAGHNGIGKSTILGLIANGSEIKKNQGTKIDGGCFQAQFHELFVLDEQGDYIKERRNKPSFQLVYKKEGCEDLVKVCNVSSHTEKILVEGIEKTYKRLKIVPRGSQERWDVGEAAKVNIPTLFLSMSRMTPLGDLQKDLNTSCLKNMLESDKVYIREKFKQVIDNKIIPDSTVIIRHEVKRTTKNSFLPSFEHSTKTISLGQDSLSTIISAFASFNKLKRTQGENYKGGILLIDEIDAGFHPKAQVKLIELIKSEAKRLDLQVIMTSHSLTIIKEVLKISDDTARGNRNIDSVIYIQNCLNPTLMVNPTYHRIKQDMFSILPTPKEKPSIKIYFEDEEAKWFFEQIVRYENMDINSLTEYELIYVAAQLGCDNLIKLYHADPYFKSVVIVFDNDVISNQMGKQLVEKNKSIITLPAYVNTENVQATQRTPEYQIYQYLCTIVSQNNHKIWKNIPPDYHSQKIKEALIDNFPIEQNSGQNKKLRERRKEWFTDNKEHFETIELIRYFSEDYHKEITQFVNDIKEAISNVIEIIQTKNN